MKSIPQIINRHWFNTRLLAALAVLMAWTCSPAQAQTTFYVGGQGVIGDTTLTTVVEGANRVATLPNSGGNWAAAGGEGIVYSSLTSPTFTVPTAGTVTLKFTHRYFFESGWDGGAVYVTVNGAGPIYVDATAFTANGYVSDLTAFNSSVFTGGGESIYRPVNRLGHTKSN